ncbi:lysine exporter LysO family protein [Marasmitruncus massiliensis]|uniref:lysine exporter LysO family protein n=1 Tax=Marasmitruncus massiliensis TaxID=1944642 RepID=UPI000C7E2B67|nr:lysine exporter LysO family protein [Marasmitruncus massiliensis]
MIFVALGSLVLGILCGGLFLSPEMTAGMDTLMSYALMILLVSVGIEVGTNKTVFRKIREYHIKILAIPLGVAVGSISGGILLGIFLGDAPNVSAAISSGFGFYSVSAVILRELGGSRLGTVAFMTNMFRELLSYLLIPLVAKYCGRYAAIAPSGATAMDTTLPAIAKSTDHETALMAVITGVVLTALVPILVPVLYNL